MFRHSGRPFCWVLLLMSVLAHPAAAQETWPLRTGSQVRIYAFCTTTRGTFPCRHVQYAGTIDRVHADSLVLTVGSESSREAVSLLAISRLDVQLGRRSACRRGALFGGLAGFLAGSVIGYVSYPEEDTCVANCFELFEGIDGRTVAAVAGSIIGTLGGALLGGAIGAQFQANHWQRVDVGKLALGLGTSHRGTRIVLAARF